MLKGGIYIMVIYARYEYSERYQELSKHLEGTAFKIEKLLQAEIVKHTIDQLAKRAGIDINEILRAAKTAAIFHDIGKALHYYQKQVDEIIRWGEEKREKHISFTFHEFVSANLYAQTICIYRNKILQYPYSNPWLVNLTIQAILLHHQGLRTITIEKLYNNMINNIIANDILSSIQNIRTVIKDLSSSIIYKEVKILVNLLEQNIDSIISSYKPQLIQQFYNLDDTTQIQISRIITGCLMIADTWDAYAAMRGKASRYVQDAVIRFLKTLGLTIYDY